MIFPSTDHSGNGNRHEVPMDITYRRVLSLLHVLINFIKHQRNCYIYCKEDVLSVPEYTEGPGTTSTKAQRAIGGAVDGYVSK